MWIVKCIIKFILIFSICELYASNYYFLNERNPREILENDGLKNMQYVDVLLWKSKIKWDTMWDDESMILQYQDIELHSIFPELGMVLHFNDALTGKFFDEKKNRFSCTIRIDEIMWYMEEACNMYINNYEPPLDSRKKYKNYFNFLILKRVGELYPDVDILPWPNCLVWENVPDGEYTLKNMRKIKRI